MPLRNQLQIILNTLLVFLTENRITVRVAKVLLSLGQRMVWWVRYSFPGPTDSPIEESLSASFNSICPLSEERILHRELPVTVNKEVHWKFKVERRRKLPGCYVGSIENGRVVGRGTVIDGSNRVVSDVSVEFRGADSHPLSQVNRLPEPDYHNQSVAVISSNGENGYFHWLFDCMPRIDLIDSCSLKPDKYYVSHEKSFQREYLRLAGIGDSKIIQSSPKKHLKSKNLIVPSLPSLPGNVSIRTCNFLNKLSNKVGGETRFSERIYISRRKCDRRNVVNEDEVIDVLEEYGFQAIFLEDLSVYDQIRAFRGAQFVVAPHGAGLSNLVFSTPDTKVIEMFSPMYVNVCYWSLCEQREIDYGYISTGIPSPPHGCDPHLVGADILVDISILEEMLKHFMLNRN